MGGRPGEERKAESGLEITKDSLRCTAYIKGKEKKEGI